MPAYFRVPDLDDSDDEDGGFVATHIETNLGILELEYCYANYPTCDVNLLVKYLALNIPSLTTLRSRGAFAPQIHEFVEQYQGLYSHLTRIKFELPRVKGFRRFL
ncbi:hypothetical protein IWW55_006170 [Coemansia sp. RSA 2706]|nr:hypothetical protein IWW55_006170 [Coemansia sp. RSA 2706]